MKAERDEVGIVRGLAWTSVGGDTLEIEVNLMPGKGKFELTGQLGDVMRESATSVPSAMTMSWIRSISSSMTSTSIFRKAQCRKMVRQQESPWQQPCCLQC